ncbi:MAG: hypothetical protein F4X56_07615 [Gammaproteobacteria bacterium]|nr:hypothetical protein [Gammaproteobacteria bacterium]
MSRSASAQPRPPCRSFSFFFKGACLSILCLVGVAGESAVLTEPETENEKTSVLVPTESEEPRSRPPKNITTFDLDTIDSLGKVEEHIRQEDLDQAEQKLKEMWINEAELTLSEKAEITYLSSRIAFIQQDVESTIGHLESVLEYRDNITYVREEEVLLRLAELYLSEKEHGKAHRRLQEWLEIVEEPKASELAFAGSLFVKIKSYTRAKEYLTRAIEQQKEDGLEVDERWSELLDHVERQLDTEN